MSNVPTNLIPTKITGLPEYEGSSTLGYMPYVLEGRTYKVQFATIAAVGAVPSTREINTGTGLGGGGDLSANRTLYILPQGVDDSRLTLTGVAAGTYGAADSVPVLTVNAQGRVTAATSVPIVLSNYVPTSRTITAGAGLTGGGDLSANRSFAVTFSSTTPEPLGTGSPGVSTVAARGDHVHPAVDLSDTTETQGVLPLSRGGTGNSLSPVAGAIVYSSNDKLYLTTAGSVGQVLRSGGPGGVPFWTDVGAGTVISVAVATANGFAGTVVSPTLSPVITLSTTVTGLLKGDGTGMSAASAGVDYVAPGAYTASGLTMATARLLGRTTASIGAAQEITVGTGLTLASGSLVNAAPDQVVSLTAGTAISVTGTYPSFTVTNTAPDQVVSLTGAGTTVVTGTYPNFTITSSDSTAGTVTSVNASGGTTGMSFTGGPITSAGTLTLNGTLAVANGGTGATNAVAALTNLGAYPASNPAGYTSNVGTVTSVSGTGTVSGLSLSGTVTSAGSLTLGGTLAVLPSNFASQTANTVLAAPNGSAGVPTFRAIVAADIPTLNQNTTGTAGNVTGIVAVANGGTGASVAGTARSNLGAAASGANTDITSIALTTGTISATPTSGTDIVNKTYADSIASGINFHQSVRLATTAALPANTYNNGASGVGATLTGNANGALSIDGVAVVAANRVLIKNEVTQANNGVYTVTQVGNGSTPYILTRATDFDSSGAGVNKIDAGDFFLVTAGSTLANTSWVQQTPLPITVGTTALVFTQFAAPVLYTAGTGLTLAGTVFSITNTGVTASTYGSASSVPVLAINAQGQVTSASSSSIAIAASQITSGALAIANGGTGATSAATALTNLGAYPASNPSGFTSNTGTVTSVNLTAGTGISVSGGPVTASGSITVVNTAPDQVVSLTGSGATTVTGTYPNFTISSPASGAGTVTSINVSGGTTGLTTSGGPVTTSGTITLAGTLGVANGGTGATTLSSGYLLKGNGVSPTSASVVYDDGTNAGVGTTSLGAKWDVKSQINVTSPSNISMNAVRASNFGYSTGYSALIVGSTSGNNTPCINVDPIANPSGAFGGLGNEVMFRNGAYFISPNSANTAYNQYLRLIDGYVQFTNSARAPIFYDSDNTAYYVDAASNSVLGNVFARGQIRATGWWGSQSASGTGLGVEIGQSGNRSYVLSYNRDTAAYGPMSFEATDFTFTGIGGGFISVDTSVRAPIFYDSNNTAYYVDPAGTSNLSGITMNGTLTGVTGRFQKNQTAGDYTTAALWTESYGSTATGIAFHISGIVGKFLEMRTDQTLYWPGTMNASGDFRAPIFYDSNNTAYYVDPASTSRMNNLSLDTIAITSGITGLTSAPITTQYYNIGTTPTWMPMTYQRAVYTSGYITHLNTGLYKNANGWGVGATGWYAAIGGSDSSPTQAWYLTYDAYIQNSLGYVSTSGSFRAPIFYDENNTAYYMDPASDTRLGGSLSVGGSRPLAYSASNGSLTIQGDAGGWGTGLYFLGSAGTTRGGFGALGSGDGFSYLWAGNAYNNAALYLYAANYAESPGSLRAPIFYDSNDTGYYVDANNTSNFYRLSSYIAARDANANWNTGFTNTPAYSYNYNGDLNGGTNAPAAGWWFYESMRHSNASNYWGTQIAWGWEDNANRLLQRNVTGGSFGSWYEYLNTSNRTYSGNLNMTGSIISTASDMRAPIFYDQNNTGYYVDPASGSNLAGDVSVGSAVYCSNWFRSYGATGWYNQSYAGGIWMNDTTWVRVYNSKAFLVDNQIAATGNVTAYYSDERLKTKTGGIDNALEKLSGLSGFLYVENDLARSLGYTNDKQQVGVSAQAVQAVLPEAVSLAPVDFETLEDGTIISKSGENYLTVDYSRLVPLLIEAIKELENKVKALEAKE